MCGFLCKGVSQMALAKCWKCKIFVKLSRYAPSLVIFSRCHHLCPLKIFGSLRHWIKTISVELHITNPEMHLLCDLEIVYVNGTHGACVCVCVCVCFQMLVYIWKLNEYGHQPFLYHDILMCSKFFQEILQKCEISENCWQYWLLNFHIRK